MAERFIRSWGDNLGEHAAEVRLRAILAEREPALRVLGANEDECGLSSTSCAKDYR